MSVLSNFGLNLLNPSWFISLPVLITYLVYLYLRKGKGQKIIVASTLLLKHLERYAEKKKKINLPLRFFFEAFILFLLVLILVTPYTVNKGDRHAVIIDNSFSMLRNYRGKPLFDEAKQELITDLKDSGSYDLYETSKGLQALTGSPFSKKNVVNALDEVSATFTSTDTERYINSVLTQQRYEKVYFLTDHKLHIEEPSFTPLIYPKLDQKIDSDNIAFTSSKFINQDLVVTISSYSEIDSKIQVVVEAAQLEGQLNFEQLSKQQVVLNRGVEQEVIFKNIKRESYVYRVVIGKVIPKNSDAIEEDNSIYISTEGIRKKGLLVSDLNALQLGLTKISALQFDSITPDKFQALEEDAFANYQLIVFHRFQPPTIGAYNSLLVYPENGSTFPITPCASSVEVTNWKKVSDIMRYIKVSKLNIANCVTFAKGGIGEVILNSNRGSLIFVRDYGEYKHIAVGFELFPFEGKNAPVISILTLNLLKAFHSNLSDGNYLNITESSNVLDETESWKNLLSNGKVSDVVDRSELSPGVYELRKKGKSAYAALNFINEEEQNLLENKEVFLIGNTEKHSVDSFNDKIKSMLLYILFTVFILDLVFVGLILRKIQ